MNILDSVKQTLEEIEKQKQALSEQEIVLAKGWADLNDKKVELKHRENSLNELADEVNDRLKKVLTDDDLKEAQKKVVEKERELGRKEAFLVKWENDLYEIEKRQDFDKKKLEEDKVSLSKDKAEYKERLKKEFFEELNRKMQ
jgi:vacuolar-type H+-ATPase subunit E/Vma4